MKKVLAICLSALLILVSLPVSIALADNDAKIVLSTDKATVCPGQTVTLSATMENNPGVIAWGIWLNYDGIFSLTEKPASGVFGSLTQSQKLETNPYAFVWSDAVNPNNTTNGVLFTANFKAADDAAEGTYEFSLFVKYADEDIIDENYEAVAFELVPVTVTIGHTFDNSCDEQCNGCDFTREGQHEYDNACDANCNNCDAERIPAAHIYDNDCDADCNVCGAARATEGHKYSSECDTDCDSCGAVREVPHSYTYACDQRCALCGELTNAEATHTIVAQEAVAPSCHYNGNVAYWYCSDCGAAWADEALTQVTNLKSVIVPAIGGEVSHIEAVEPGCHMIGNIEYWVCYECEQVWQDAALTQLTNSKNVILPAKGGDVAHIEAVEPGCHMIGNIEYWVCYECEQVWQDAALTQLTNIKNVILPEKGGDVAHIDAVAPGCHYIGNIEYWVCYECEQVWQDEARTQLTNSKNVLLPALESTATKVEAKAPTCTENGNVEYWTCAECEQVWTDEALTQLSNIKNVQIAPAHTGVQHKEAVAPACHYNGNIEYWVCYDCETWFADEALTQITNSKNVILPALGGDVAHIEAVAPGCHMVGNIEYWVCYECEQVWQDAALTQLTNIKNVILPATGGEVVAHEAVAPGCHYIGNIAYWTCAECEQVWQDEALTQLTNIKNVILPALESTATKVEAKAPTCTENGNVEYWTCDKCEKVWADEALTQLTNIKNVQIAPAHTGVQHKEAIAPACHYEGNIEYWVCYDCETWFADEALTQITNSKNVILPALESTATKVDAKAPTCTENGNVEYWVCEKCEQVWADEALTQLTNIKNVQIAPSCSHNAIHNEGVAAGCHYTGRIENWYCATCDVYYLDAECTQITNYKSLTIPALESTATKVEAKAPTCTENGNVEYWACEKCEQVWADEALTQLTNIKNVQIAPSCSYNAIHNEGIEAGCHFTGRIENWYCATCDVYYLDAECTQITNYKSLTIAAKGGDVKHVEAKAPTATENGNIEYWYCEECEQVWQDEALTQLTNHKNVIIPALGEETTTTTKPEAEGDKPSKPMGENTLPVIVCGLIALIAAAGAVLFSKKKA